MIFKTVLYTIQFHSDRVLINLYLLSRCFFVIKLDFLKVETVPLPTQVDTLDGTTYPPIPLRLTEICTTLHRIGYIALQSTAFLKTFAHLYASFIFLPFGYFLQMDREIQSELCCFHRQLHCLQVVPDCSLAFQACNLCIQVSPPTLQWEESIALCTSHLSFFQSQ